MVCAETTVEEEQRKLADFQSELARHLKLKEDDEKRLQDASRVPGPAAASAATVPASAAAAQKRQDDIVMEEDTEDLPANEENKDSPAATAVAAEEVSPAKTPSSSAAGSPIDLSGFGGSGQGIDFSSSAAPLSPPSAASPAELAGVLAASQPLGAGAAAAGGAQKSAVPPAPVAAVTSTTTSDKPEVASVAIEPKKAGAEASTMEVKSAKTSTFLPVEKFAQLEGKAWAKVILPVYTKDGKRRAKDSSGKLKFVVIQRPRTPFWNGSKQLFLTTLNGFAPSKAKKRTIDNPIKPLVEQAQRSVPTLWPQGLQWKESWEVNMQNYGVVDEDDKEIGTRQSWLDEILIENAIYRWDQDVGPKEPTAAQIAQDQGRVEKIVGDKQFVNDLVNFKRDYSGLKRLAKDIDTREIARFVNLEGKEMSASEVHTWNNRGSLFSVFRFSAENADDAKVQAAKLLNAYYKRTEPDKVKAGVIAEVKPADIPFLPLYLPADADPKLIGTLPTEGLSDRQQEHATFIDNQWTQEWNIMLNMLEMADARSPKGAGQGRVPPGTLVRSVVEGEPRPAEVLIHLPNDDSVFVQEPSKAFGVHRVPLSQLRFLAHSDQPYDRVKTMMHTSVNDVRVAMKHIFMLRKFSAVYDWFLADNGPIETLLGKMKVDPWQQKACHIHTYTPLHTYTHTCAYTRTPVHIHLYIHLHTYTHTPHEA